MPCLRTCEFSRSDLVLEELIKGLHELLWRPRLDDVAIGQTVAKQLAETPGLPDDYTSGLVDY